MIKYVKTHPDAQLLAPYSTDSGYDIYITTWLGTKGVVELFGTGIKVQPPDGFYFDLVPRSSIIKTGYILANSIGIIDASYQGEILIPLLKVDPDMASPAVWFTQPIRVAQLILRPLIKFPLTLVESFDTVTERSDKGFGSSGTT